MSWKRVICIVRDGERYVFVFTDADDLLELCSAVGRQAADPELSFTWLDATIVVQRARAMIAAGAR